MELVWGLTEITLRSALRGACHVHGANTSFLPRVGSHCTIREDPQLENLAEQLGSGGGPWPPAVVWVRSRLLPCQRWTNDFMKNPACDFSV